jgi:hypothetical protein
LTEEALEPGQGLRQVLPPEAEAEMVAREPELRAGQEEDALGLDQARRKRIDRLIVEKAREADRPAPWPDP